MGKYTHDVSEFSKHDTVPWSRPVDLLLNRQRSLSLRRSIDVMRLTKGLIDSTQVGNEFSLTLGRDVKPVFEVVTSQ